MAPGRRSALLGLVSSLTLACATAERPAPFDPPLTIPYRDGAIAAGGQVEAGSPCGPWRFFYPDGALLAEGTLDALGRPVGSWTLYERDGSVSRRRTQLVCRATTVYHDTAGLDERLLDLLDEPYRAAMRAAFPHALEGWNGTGYYFDGQGVPLAEGEVLLATLRGIPMPWSFADADFELGRESVDGEELEYLLWPRPGLGGISALDLPPGEYVLSARDPDQFWFPPSVRVSVPGPPAEFVLVEPPADAAIEVRVRDADDGELLECGVDVHYFRSPEANGHRGQLSSRFVIERWPRRTEFFWFVGAEGRGTTCGDASDLHDEDGRRVLDVRLPAPGWNQVFSVVDEAGIPFVGAELLADGVHVASTSESGCALVRLPARPTRIDVFAPGYRIHPDSSIDPATGEVSESVPLHEIWVRLVPR